MLFNPLPSEELPLRNSAIAVHMSNIVAEHIVSRTQMLPAVLIVGNSACKFSLQNPSTVVSQPPIPQPRPLSPSCSCPKLAIGPKAQQACFSTRSPPRSCPPRTTCPTAPMQLPNWWPILGLAIKSPLVARSTAASSKISWRAPRSVLCARPQLWTLLASPTSSIAAYV